jgi:hypothetical protein
MSELLILFSKPQLNFQKIKMAPILLSITLNFGCSSYDNSYVANAKIKQKTPKQHEGITLQ